MELRLEHLVKDFSGTKAVNDVSITIQDGKLTGLLGPSGCGKSTTLYLISGLESPTSGRIFFGDRDVTALPPEKRGIGLVFSELCPLSPSDGGAKHRLVNLGGKEGRRHATRNDWVQIGEDLLKRKPRPSPAAITGGHARALRVKRLISSWTLSNLGRPPAIGDAGRDSPHPTETGVTVFITIDLRKP